MPEKEKPDKADIGNRCIDWKCYKGTAKWCNECTPERKMQCTEEAKDANKQG